MPIFAGITAHATLMKHFRNVLATDTGMLPMDTHRAPIGVFANPPVQGFFRRFHPD